MDAACDRMRMRPRTRLGAVQRRWVIVPAVLLLFATTTVLTASAPALSQRAPDGPQHSVPLATGGRTNTHDVVMAGHPLTTKAVGSCQSCH
jgi:hypothetical protein